MTCARLPLPTLMPQSRTNRGSGTSDSAGASRAQVASMAQRSAHMRSPHVAYARCARALRCLRAGRINWREKYTHLLRAHTPFWKGMFDAGIAHRHVYETHTYMVGMITSVLFLRILGAGLAQEFLFYVHT